MVNSSISNANVGPNGDGTIVGAGQKYLQIGVYFSQDYSTIEQIGHFLENIHYIRSRILYLLITKTQPSNKMVIFLNLYNIIFSI